MDATKDELEKALKAAEACKLKAETTKLQAEIAKLEAERELARVKSRWNPVLVVGLLVIATSAAWLTSHGLCQ